MADNNSVGWMAVLVTGLFTGLVASVMSLETFDMNELCGRELSMIWRSVTQAQLHVTLDTVVNSGCHVTIIAWYYLPRIMFYFKHLNLPCDVGYLEFFDGDDTPSPGIQGLDRVCGDSVPEGLFDGTTRYLTVRYTAVQEAQMVYNATEIVFTAFSTGDCDFRYRCDNGRCISRELRCNNFNPCGDNSDCHKHDDDDATDVPTSVIWISVAVLSVVITTSLWYYCRVKGRSSGYRQGSQGTLPRNIQPHDQQPRPVSSVGEETQSLQDPYDETGVNQEPPAYSTVTSPPVGVDPPPYSAVMASQDTYKVLPPTHVL